MIRPLDVGPDRRWQVVPHPTGLGLPENGKDMAMTYTGSALTQLDKQLAEEQGRLCRMERRFATWLNFIGLGISKRFAALRRQRFERTVVVHFVKNHMYDSKPLKEADYVQIYGAVKHMLSRQRLTMTELNVVPMQTFVSFMDHYTTVLVKVTVR